MLNTHLPKNTNSLTPFLTVTEFDFNYSLCTKRCQSKIVSPYKKYYLLHKHVDSAEPLALWTPDLWATCNILLAQTGHLKFCKISSGAPESAYEYLNLRIKSGNNYCLSTKRLSIMIFLKLHLMWAT